jgi:ElaA protein
MPTKHTSTTASNAKRRWRNIRHRSRRSSLPDSLLAVTIAVRYAAVSAMDPQTLYGVLRLRSAVFVVEQDCAYLDLDRRDVEAGAVLVWAQQGEDVLATLRLLSESDGSARIGRVATLPSARSEGLAARLMDRAIELAGGRAIVLEAQAQLERWYERFGFLRTGEDYLEDDILHTPMRRPSQT